MIGLKIGLISNPAVWRDRFVLNSKYARFRIPTDSVVQNHDVESTIDLLQKMVKKSIRLGRVRSNRKKKDFKETIRW